MSCFYFCFFLLIFVFKVLGSLEIFLVAYGQARHGGGYISNNTGAVRMPAYIQKEKWQIAPAW